MPSNFHTSIQPEPYGKLTGDRSGPRRPGEPFHIKHLDMARIFAGLLVVIVVVLAGGVIFLGTYQQPPSTTKMEVQIPNDRLSLQ